MLPTPTLRPARVLIVAGSDSGGGAGIQGDLKTVTLLGGFGMTAITALTAQNTHGVSGIHNVPTDFIIQQMEMVLQDIGADSIKTGMLHRAEIIHAVADTLEKHCPQLPLIVDPVMVAKGGAALLEASATKALRERLVPMASVLTPNIPEAEALLNGRRITGLPDMKLAAEELLELGAHAVVLKGGHLGGNTVYDVLLSKEEYEVFESPRIQTAHTHGTGCTLASAIATLMVGEKKLAYAVGRAREYVRKAILTAPHLGSGHGPLNHAHPLHEHP